MYKSLLETPERIEFEKLYGLKKGEYNKLPVSKKLQVRQAYFDFLKEKSSIKKAPMFVDKELNEISRSEWMEKFKDNDYRILKQDIEHSYLISTIWLGINHGLETMPEYFETMVFKVNSSGETNGEDLFLERTTTKKEALLVHEKIVKHIKKTKSVPEKDLI